MCRKWPYTTMCISLATNHQLGIQQNDKMLPYKNWQESLDSSDFFCFLEIGLLSWLLDDSFAFLINWVLWTLLLCVYPQESLESSVNCVCCFFRKWSVDVVTVFRRMEFVSSLDTHFMMGSQRNTQCFMTGHFIEIGLFSWLSSQATLLRSVF